MTAATRSRLRARLDVEQQLIDDATARGWQRETGRHTATKTRIEQLLKDLRQEPDSAPAGGSVLTIMR